MTEEIRIVSKSELTVFAQDIFKAAGVEDPNASLWAEVLVWANLRGVDSHGVLRIPTYVQRIRSGAINPAPDLRVERSAGAIAVIEADLAPGPLAMCFAMDEAIQRAREVHIGWCAVRNLTHAGAIGFYARRAAEAGMAGLAMTASFPMMPFPGSREPSVSTNPMAIAVPGKEHPPLMIDLSTANVAFGKIWRARDAGEEIPVGWGLDAEGRDTTDPNAVTTLMPLGGAKGAGLSLMIECLSSLAVANPLIAPTLAPGGNPPGGRPNNGLVVAIDLAAFGDIDAYKREIDALAEALTGQPKAEGVDRIYAPGERGDSVLAARESEGLPLPAGTWQRLTEVANELGVSLPKDA